MEKYIEKINKPHDVLKIDNNFVEIKTEIEFKRGIGLKIFLKRIEDKIFITDNKHTLRYMNTLYQLGATDVKQCINDIVNYYKFKIEKGEILAEVNLININKRFNEFLICCSTLANMFIFFDQPLEN